LRPIKNERLSVDMKSSPIGVFDSGIGGLTVLKEIIRLLPDEDIVYLGDTARVPYGTKSRETVRRYSFENSAFLRARGVKLVVAACNTASAYAIADLREAMDIPVTGVIVPGARAAIKASPSGRVAIIGTEGTMGSHAYSRVIREMRPGAEVIEKACPLVVPLVEEGFLEDRATELIVERYLGELRGRGIDTLVLGCTHYPLLKGPISGVMGGGVRLIDSAEATAAVVKALLEERGMENTNGRGGGTHRFFVTDSPRRFQRVGRLFFGEDLPEPDLVSLQSGGAGATLS